MKKTFNCICGKTYTQESNMYRHRKTCVTYNQTTVTNITNITNVSSSEVEELKKKILAYEQALAERDHTIELQQQTISNLNNTVDMHKQTIVTNENMINKLLSVIQCNNTNTNTVTNTIVKNVEPKPEPIIKPEAKKTSIKEYLDSCTPVLFDTFMKQYTPSIEDCSNILRYGLCEGAIRNFNAYVSKYDKKCYPIVITNQQNIRMKLYVCEKEGEWKKICNNDALKFIGSVVERMINRIWSNVVPIYTAKYPGFSDPSDPNIENYRNIKCSIMQSLRNSEIHTTKIVNKIKEHFCILKNEEIE